MKLVDLTHTFTASIPVFPGDPKPSLEQVAFIEKDSFNDHKISTVMHVGTHMDAPLHMIAGGKTIDELPPEKFVGKGILIDVRGKDVIDSSVLDGVTITKDAIVLLYTGFAKKYGEESYYTKCPSIAEDFAKKMVDLKIKLLCMDMAGPDPDAPWPVHKILLGNDIYILEDLCNLAALVSSKAFEVMALPAKIQSDAAPVRVIARV